jgi:hypothetical protein
MGQFIHSNRSPFQTVPTDLLNFEAKVEVQVAWDTSLFFLKVLYSRRLYLQEAQARESVG